MNNEGISEHTEDSWKAEEFRCVSDAIAKTIEELLKGLAHRTNTRIIDININCFGHSYCDGKEWPMVAVESIVLSPPTSSSKG
jgi:hypothetical protein